MGARRRYAHKRQDIFKQSYDEIIKSAKRKHSEEFYIFKTVISDREWFSECSVDAIGNSFEHWEKANGKWQKRRSNETTEQISNYSQGKANVTVEAVGTDGHTESDLKQV